MIAKPPNQAFGATLERIVEPHICEMGITEMETDRSKKDQD
jgi:hypothetical protein